MGTEQHERTGLERRPIDGLVGRAKANLKEYWFEYLLFVPTLLFLVLLMWIPFFRGLWMSLHVWTAFEQKWVGLENYTFLFTWDNFFVSMKATVLFATTTLMQLIVAMVAALLVYNMDRFKNLTDGLFLVPYTMAPVVTGLIWKFLMNPDFGPLIQYPVKWGFLDKTVYWGSNGALSLTAITLVTAWTFWPFMFIILLATLEGIPKSHYEAAQVYGANRVQTFWRVTFPQLKTALLIVISLRLIWNLTKVSQPLTLTGGGPGYDTSVLAILLYRYSWSQGAMGLSYAVGIVLVLLTLAFIIQFITAFERESEVEFR